MLHLTNLLLVCLLLANLAGLTVIVYGATRSWLLARTASPLVVAIPFFIEHFWGFGGLAWLWPFTTAISAILILLHRHLLKTHWRIEAVFHAAFAYALAWRYSFPDITASSEKITDLTFVANYLHGDRLPPVDRWLPPLPFDIYYAMQHYAAALLGRILATPAGTAYNLSICVILAAAVTAGAGTAWLLVRRRGPAVLLTVALVFGGTGVSPLIRLITPNPPLHYSIRFMGSSLSPELATRPLGKLLVKADLIRQYPPPDLPVELLSYLVSLGDFHPPLSGYLLLMLALLSIALIEAGQAVRPAYALLAATVPLTIPCNAWDFPIQAILVGAYLLYRARSHMPVAWKALALGGAIAAILIAPFLLRFVPHARQLHNSLAFVLLGWHTRPFEGLLVFYPLFAVLALNWKYGERSGLSRTLLLLWFGLLVASEFVYVNDIYAGRYDRFNTVLKWWSWIYSGTLLTVGAINLRSPSRVCRRGTAAVLLLISVYAVDLGWTLIHGRKPHLGQLDGAGRLRDDKAQAAILDFLRDQPQSIVLQRLPDEAYITAPSLITFAGQTPFLGWANHENIWRGYPPQSKQRFDDIKRFYQGELPDGANWLERNHIRYVLWLNDENKLPGGTFGKIDRQIRGRYLWQDRSVPPGVRAGLWSRTGE